MRKKTSKSVKRKPLKERRGLLAFLAVCFTFLMIGVICCSYVLHNVIKTVNGESLIGRIKTRQPLFTLMTKVAAPLSLFVFTALRTGFGLKVRICQNG